MARKIVFHKHGDPIKVLNLEEAACPQPGAGEVLVKVIKLPIHSGDFLMVTGLHNPTEFTVPKDGLTPGAEGVGIVEALGTDVDAARGLIPGARVSFFVVGAWKEKLVLPADTVFVVPQEVDDDLASQLYVNPLAALLIVREVVGMAGHRPGVLRRSVNSVVLTGQEPASKEPGVVILSAAASVTAKLIAALLKEKGFTPIGMVRSRSAVTTLRASTGVWAVCTEDSDWKDQLRKEVGDREIFAALDAVGGKLSSDMLRLLSPGGTLLSYGILSGEPCFIPQAPLTMENKTVRGVGMLHWSLLPLETRAKDVALLTEFLQRNRQLLPTLKEFKMSEMKDAVELFSKPGRDGIIMMVP
jgi:NADPH:quinone reductase-like Zn-dependent oxidoreductase